MPYGLKILAKRNVRLYTEYCEFWVVEGL